MGQGSLELHSVCHAGARLISHCRHLKYEERVPFGPELILRGALERLAPILMTAACAALALVPLVIRGKIPGHEIEYPMALVILGGLVTSTVLNLPGAVWLAGAGESISSNVLAVKGECLGIAVAKLYHGDVLQVHPISSLPFRHWADGF